jgi:regulator of sirC expression with transglutaminase-like and TPR domain
MAKEDAGDCSTGPRDSSCEDPLMIPIRRSARLFLIAGVLFTAGTPRASHAEDAAAAPTVEQVARKARDSVVVVSHGDRDGGQGGLGAGFVIDKQGLIATNLHVIGEARPIRVQLADGRKFDVVEVLASDRNLDLAVVRIEAEGLSPLELGGDAPPQGEPIVAMGNPHGLRHSVVSGVVSGTREIDGRQMLQLAMPIEPGNSGGPVLDMQGRVRGIVTMKSLVTENLGFAVDVNSLKPLLEKPNPIPISRWLTIGALDGDDWQTLLGAAWRQRSGRIAVTGAGKGFGGRSLCIWQHDPPEPPFEIGVAVKLDDEAGAAGLIFHSDGGDRHYGFYPSSGRLRLSRFEGPDVFSWQVLEEVPSQHYRPGEWNYLKIRVEPKKILCYVNDELVVESTDRGLTKGRVGLAKFRQTEAEFKQFRVAKEIPSSQPDAETLAEINALIEQLPALAEATGQRLAPLADEGHAASQVLRERARELERRAEELRRFAADAHALSVAARLGEVMKQTEQKIDLVEAALLIALLDDEELDVEAYAAQVKRMADAVRKRLPDDADAAAKREALGKYLFEEHGFHGSRTEFYHRANSYLNRVLDDREGLPITLSVLYLELGRRLGLELEGVNMPKHFVVRQALPGGESQLIDVFEGGKLLSRADAEQLVRDFVGRELVEEDLAAAGKRDIVLRMLSNLLGVAERDDDHEGLLRYLEAMIAVEPELVRERGMRAVLRAQTGRSAAAVADLDWFLEHEPEGIELDKIREMREFFLRKR